MKKLALVLLSLALVLGLCTPVLAAENRVAPGSKTEVMILDADMFDSDVSDGDGLTRAKLTKAGFRLQKSLTRGKECLKDVYFENITQGGEKKVAVVVQFADPFVSVADKDFYFEISLVQNNETYMSAAIDGTLGNDEITVSKKASVDLSDGTVAKAAETIPDILIEAGHGVRVRTRMNKDGKYYAMAVETMTARDEKVIAQNPKVATALTLYTVGLEKLAYGVRFNLKTAYHVYDGAGNYLGTTKDEVPLASKYYLATEKVTVTIPK